MGTPDSADLSVVQKDEPVVPTVIGACAVENQVGQAHTCIGSWAGTAQASI